MAEWLMSVVGIVAAGVLLEIILPPGDTAKYAKGAYALIVVLVLASPIANVLSQFKTIEGDATAAVDGAFLSEVYDRIEESDEERAETALSAAGFDGCKVNIFAAAGKTYRPQRANVDVSDCKSASDGDKDEIAEIVKNCLGCEEVKIYGQRE